MANIDMIVFKQFEILQYANLLALLSGFEDHQNSEICFAHFGSICFSL